MDLPVSLSRRLGGVLTGSPRFCRWIYCFFLWIYRHRGWRYLYQVTVSLVFALGTNAVISLHKLPDTASWDLITAIGTAIIVIGALIVTSFPLAIIAHGRRSGRQRDRYLAGQISAMLGSIEHSEPGLPAEHAVPELLEQIDGYNGSIYILSPNALYPLADRWLPMIGKRIGSVEQARLRKIAEHSGAFREALLRHQGPLHWVLPDPNDPEVQSLLSHRSQSLALEGVPLLKANQEALRWLRRELQKQRARQGLSTRIHLCCFLPQFRVVLKEDSGAFQQLGQRYGFMSPVHRVNMDSPVWSALANAINGWCGDI